MQTATLEAVTIKLELFGKSIYRLLGERVIADENGNITFSYSNLPEEVKITRKKILPALENKKSRHQKFDFYELSFLEEHSQLAIDLILESDDNLVYAEKNSKRSSGKFDIDHISNNAISTNSNYLAAFVPEKFK